MVWTRKICVALKTLVVTKNSDQTITVRSGRMVEHFNAADKTKEEIFDWVKWIAITHRIVLDDIQITEILRAIK